jgi:acyl-CoA synthetase (NDP forming)
VLADPNIGMLVVPITGAFPPMSDKFVADLVDVSTTTDKPICVIWGSPSGTEDAYRKGLLGSNLPVFRTFGNCVTAIRAFLDYHAFTDRVGDLLDPPSTVDIPPPGGSLLNEYESKRLLAEYGIAVSRDIPCADPEEAFRAAASFDGPVVVKAVCADLPHKSDLGLVRLGVTPDQVRAVFDEFAGIVAAQGSTMDGVLVCEQLSGGVETVVGIATDELFGPVVMAGIGGVAVEVYKDVTFRVPPFGRTEAHRMLDELRGRALLDGYRGKPKVDREALVDVIMAVQRMARDGAVRELDVNPLLALPSGAVALDALARVGVHNGL